MVLKDMGLYELKMYLKRFYPIKKVVEFRKEKQFKTQNNILNKSGTEIFFEINEILNASPNKIFVDFGTLLGAVRENDLLSWDSDIDYGVVIDDVFSWDNFEEFMFVHNMKKIKEFQFDGRITEQTYRYKDITIDFFAHFNNEIEGNVFFYYRKENYIYHNNAEYHAVLIKTPVINEITYGNVRNEVVNIPLNFEVYLESVYTKNWRIPDPNWNGNNASYNNRIEFPGKGRITYFE